MNFSYHHVHFVCSDLEEMIAFWTEVFDGKLVGRTKFGGTDGARMDVGGTLVNLRVASAGETITQDSSSTRFGCDHIGFEVEDINAAYTELQKKGVTFTMTPTDLGTVTIAFLKGPDNIIVEILQVTG